MSDTDMVHYFQSLEKKEADELNRLYNAEDKGLAKGLAEGRAEGLAKGKAEVALRLAQRDLPIAEIADMVGITEAEVQQIIDNSTE
ncbi:MAG: hypothetical protein GX801_00025 [Fibrobacter sp.]|nr:hypothetical protein [Fibrobacter sp.]